MIALFAYDFPHRKTNDFIIELLVRFGTSFCVLAAPARKLEVDRFVYYPQSLKASQPVDTRTLCQSLNIPFYSVGHEDAQRIAELKVQHAFTLGVVAGARIIPSKVIDIFSGGIINFHPGLIPETSGLDSFYYTIAKNVQAGVTAHFIDARVDAGELIFFEPLPIGPEDTPEIINFNNSQLQIMALRKVLDFLDAGTTPKTVPLSRPKKNPPMRSEEKIATLQKFAAWRASMFLLQQKEKLFKSCELGRLDPIHKIIAAHPSLLEAHTPQGWTPLVLAAFNGHKPIVEYLLGQGANPNACGLKGTTVLMYAKNRLLHNPAADFTIVELLIAYGADMLRCDMYGRTILDYVREAGDYQLLEKLELLGR